VCTYFHARKGNVVAGVARLNAVGDVCRAAYESLRNSKSLASLFQQVTNDSATSPVAANAVPLESLKVLFDAYIEMSRHQLMKSTTLYEMMLANASLDRRFTVPRYLV
jgi:hypothetical protein